VRRSLPEQRPGQPQEFCWSSVAKPRHAGRFPAGEPPEAGPDRGVEASIDVGAAVREFAVVALAHGVLRQVAMGDQASSRIVKLRSAWLGHGRR
jgi:hypothetical protein